MKIKYFSTRLKCMPETSATAFRLVGVGRLGVNGGEGEIQIAWNIVENCVGMKYNECRGNGHEMENCSD